MIVVMVVKLQKLTKNHKFYPHTIVQYVNYTRMKLLQTRARLKGNVSSGYL